MPRGRATGSKNRDTDDAITNAPSDISSFSLADLPPKLLNGEPNPDYYATLLDRANLMYFEQTLVSGGKSDFNYQSFQKGVIEAAEMAGLSKRSITDRRTDADKAVDAANDLKRMDRSMLELLDEELDALEAAMDVADKKCAAYLDDKQHSADGDPSRPKAWRVRIQRVRTLRDRARNRIPNSSHKGNQYQDRDLIRASLEAAHPLRFMVYVDRSSMDMSKRFSRTVNPTPAEYVFDIGDHYAKLACDIWICRNGVRFAYDKKNAKPVIERGIVPYVGILAMLPVGVGKTSFCNNYAALEVCIHPKPQIIMLHAVHDMSKQNLADVKKCFDGDSDKRRRCRSLFPHLHLADYHNDSTRLRVAQKNPTKSPSITAAGVDSARLGVDSHLQILDDIVPQTDADRPSEREARWKSVQGTFGTRQRGQNVFRIIVGTPWHAGDALMRIKELAKQAAASNSQRGVCYGVSIQRCGGPNTSPKFKPLWPKVQTVFDLKAKYQEFGPSLYAAAMMMNPLTDEQRIVKKIRLYDPDTAEHRQFVTNSIKYISLDPAATKESHSDKAGIIYAGIGDVRVLTESDGIQVAGTEKRVRMLMAHEIHATQSELTEYVCNFALQNEVSYVLAEAVAGFRAIIEMFQEKGIDAIASNPRGKSKENRLRGVAPILEDSNASLNFRAVAEFPGVRNEKGDLVLHPMFKGVVEQIIDYGVCADDHSLDAVTQLLGYLAPELGVGRGVVSDRVRMNEKISGDPRLIAIYNQLERQHKLGKNATSEQAEHEWMQHNWSSSRASSSD